LPQASWGFPYVLNGAQRSSHSRLWLAGEGSWSALWGRSG
jgi:hypothetical protein